jgi:hypothetical protein
MAESCKEGHDLGGRFANDDDDDDPESWTDSVRFKI